MNSFKVKKPYTEDFDRLMEEELIKINKIGKGLYYGKLAKKHSDILKVDRVRVNGWVLKKKKNFGLASDKFNYKVYSYED